MVDQGKPSLEVGARTWLQLDESERVRPDFLDQQGRVLTNALRDQSVKSPTAVVNEFVVSNHLLNLVRPDLIIHQ